jgi:hypothetical protein
VLLQRAPAGGLADSQTPLQEIQPNRHLFPVEQASRSFRSILEDDMRPRLAWLKTKFIHIDEDEELGYWRALPAQMLGNRQSTHWTRKLEYNYFTKKIMPNALILDS